MSQQPVSSTPLPKCKTDNPITSTPYPHNNVQLRSYLFDQYLSPVAFPAHAQEASKQLPQPTASNVEKPLDVVPVTKKRKQPTKVTESVSSKVLKELGRVPVSLSCSRNKFYMYPEPVILDSDEEGDAALHTSSKNLPKQETKTKITKPKKTTNKRNTEKSTKLVQQKCCEDNIETSPSVIILDEEENLFSSLILVKNSKDKVKKISSKENRIEEIDSVAWTPRKLRNKKKVSCIENLNTLEGDQENTKSKIPSEYISNFKDVVFKHNKHSGGVVASCLETPVLKLGYIEIVKGECFNGKSSDITLTMVEGTIEASLLKSTVTLSAGDMLHIPGPDTKYQLKSTTKQARLHYVKNKH